MRITKHLSIALAVLFCIAAFATETPQKIPFWGYLTEKDGTPITGAQNIKFELYDAETGGKLVWSEVQSGVELKEGQLSVTLGDVESLNNKLAASDLWLCVTVNPGSKEEEVLAPRTRLLPVAGKYDQGGGGRPDPNGSLDARYTTDTLYVTKYIQAGTASGSSANSNYSFTAGYNCDANASYSGITNGYNNTIGSTAHYSHIGGGQSNSTSDQYCVVGGGRENIAISGYAVVGGGYSNESSAFRTTVGGGANNNALDEYATVSGGASNEVTATGGAGTISGGASNMVSGEYATISGGGYNRARGNFSFVGGGGGGTAADSNSALGERSVVVGGRRNYARGEYSFVGGGGGSTAADSNSALGDWSVVCGGRGNVALGDSSAILGGSRNNIAIQAYGATIGGGSFNEASGMFSVVAGGGGLEKHTSGSPAGNKAQGWYGAIGGGSNNTIEVITNYSTIAGGAANRINESSYWSAIGGGRFNEIGNENMAMGSTIGGGEQNRTNANWTTVGGGYSNDAEEDNAAICGGVGNRASGESSAVVGGVLNTAKGDYSFVGGGGGYSTGADSNYAGGDYSMIVGGRSNMIADTAECAFASGYDATANHPGSFVWSSGAATSSFATNSVAFRAHGGMRVYTAAGTGTGVSLVAGGGAWASLSDRNKKENIKSINTAEILDKVDQLPVLQWNYKSQDESVQHIGPMAQDFHKLFGLGDDDVTITTIDPDGIALAAIQELSKRVRDLEAENASMKASLASLSEVVETLAARDSNIQKASFTPSETGSTNTGGF